MDFLIFNGLSWLLLTLRSLDDLIVEELQALGHCNILLNCFIWVKCSILDEHMRQVTFLADPEPCKVIKQEWCICKLQSSCDLVLILFWLGILVIFINKMTATSLVS